MNYLIHRNRDKLRRQKNRFQIKQHDKTSEKELSEREISNLPNKEFKIRVVKMLPELGRRKDKLSESFSKDRKYKKEPITAEK